MGTESTKRFVLETRPFQSLFKGAQDLLNLARPYFDHIKSIELTHGEHGIPSIDQGLWRTEKSLAIGSFMLTYSGLEALVNCIHKDFKLGNVDALPETSLPDPLAKLRNRLSGLDFESWQLRNRVFLLAPLCTSPPVDPCSVFDPAGPEWERFEELIEIRHAFQHPQSVTREMLLARRTPKVILANDQFSTNVWPRTGTPRDHSILNFEAATKLRDIALWVVGRLRGALPHLITVKYLMTEDGKFEDI